MKINLQSYFPILEWGKVYTGKTAVNDLVVALIVTIMLIPQSLAYAQLAGLSPEVGLYASMGPLVLYAIFGTSRTLSVGPVAMASVLTMAAVAPLATAGTPEYLGASIALALITGLILILLGFLKLGFITNFISFPVMAGLSSAIGLQIATSQLKPILGVSIEGNSFLQQIISLIHNFDQINLIVATIGISTVVFLMLTKKYLSSLLTGLGIGKKLADILAKMGPVIAIVVTISIVSSFGLDKEGVKIVGNVPKGLPSLVFPPFDLELWSQLLTPAILLAILGYVGSLSVAQTLASKKRQHINPNQELLALGAANLGAAFCGGLPVSGGFSRSIVNYDAGAETQASGIFTAIGIALVALFLTPLLYFLPNAALGATIFVAVISMVKFKPVIMAYAYSKPDGIAMGLTIILTLTLGVIVGLIAGIAASLMMYLYRTSRPHIAVLGQVTGSQSFKNVDRQEVVTSPQIVSMRIDESIYFPNAKFLESKVNEIIAINKEIKYLILNCSAVNSIDISGLESLKAINERLKVAGIAFHLAEIKGPIMDDLKKTQFFKDMSGRIHMTHYDALHSINPELAQNTLNNEK
jgi:SulP family sulfate permease